MDSGNWKMKCLDDGGCSFCKTGKVYEVKNGIFETEGGSNSFKYKSFEDFIMHKKNTLWELIEEKSGFTLKDIKEGYLVKIRDGRVLLVVRMEDGMLRGYSMSSNPIISFNKKNYDEAMNYSYYGINEKKYSVLS